MILLFVRKSSNLEETSLHSLFILVSCDSYSYFNQKFYLQKINSYYTLFLWYSDRQKMHNNIKFITIYRNGLSDKQVQPRIERNVYSLHGKSPQTLKKRDQIIINSNFNQMQTPYSYEMSKMYDSVITKKYTKS